MTPLHKKILEKCEPPDLTESFVKECIANNTDKEQPLLYVGKLRENSRLLPIISSLLEQNERLVKLIERTTCWNENAVKRPCDEFAPDHIMVCPRCACLTANAKELERLAKGDDNG